MLAESKLGAPVDEEFDGLAFARAEVVAQALADVLACEILGPVALGGAGLNEPVEARAVVPALAVEHRGRGADRVGMLLARAAEPGRVHEWKAGEFFPREAEVELVRIVRCEGRIGDDFVADEQNGRRPRVVCGWLKRSATGADGDVLSRVVVDDLDCAVESALNDDAEQGDGRVAVGVGVNVGEAVDGEGAEEADGEGGAVGADHAHGKNRDTRAGGVNDGSERDVNGVIEQQADERAGDGGDERGVFPDLQTFDERERVEVLDEADAGGHG